MKSTLINILKIAVPLGIGVWLIYYFYNQLSPAQREQLFDAFKAADMGWLWLATAIGWLAHVSRGWRWRYALEPLGYRPGFWNCYHAVMIGYFMNMFLPRAGEASRAASLYRTEQVPFEQGFGTVLAERAVDTLMLLLIACVTLVFQLERIDQFKERITAFRAAQTPVSDNGLPWGMIVGGLVGAGLLVMVYLMITRPQLQARAKDLVRGFVQGLKGVLRTRHKGSFALHTVLIWVAYLAMFQLGFYCLPTMADVPFAGILAGFIAGAIGIVLVQGGIGVYPAFVALIVGVYMTPADGGGLIRPDALAMGWLLWAAQTLMIIVLGGVSLLLTSFKKPSV